MTARRVALAAAVLMVAAVGGLSAPASARPAAAMCAPGAGVSLVVEFGALGGGTQTHCAPNGAGSSASTVLANAGYALTYVQRQPGFLCRINGLPADDPCVNTPPGTAYWGLYWSTGTSGTWSYATLGVTSLEVPEGGAVAFVWQSGATREQPSVAPPRAVAASPSASPSANPSASPTRTPTKAPTSTPTRTSTGSPTPAPGPTRTATPATSPAPAATSASSARPSRGAGKPNGSAKPDAGATSETATAVESPAPESSATPGEAAPEATAPATPAATGGSVPLPLVLAVIALLGALVAGTVVVRSRRAP